MTFEVVGVSASVAVVISFLSAYAFYSLGYLKGYTAGLAYGSKGLQEYHEYTMNSLQNLSKQESKPCD